MSGYPSFTTLSDFQRIKSLLWFQGHFFSPQASIPDALHPCSPILYLHGVLTVSRTCPAVSTSGPLHGYLCHTSSFTSCHLHRKDSLNSIPKRAPVLKLLLLSALAHFTSVLGVISVMFALKHILTYGQFFLFLAF